MSGFVEALRSAFQPGISRNVLVTIKYIFRAIDSLVNYLGNPFCYFADYYLTARVT